MSASFVTASNQRLFNAATPITGYPCSVGLWVRPTATGVASRIFQIADSASTNSFSLEVNTSNQFEIECNGGTSIAIVTTPTFTSGNWYYLVGRFISATNRRLVVLSFDGAIGSISSVVNTTPTGLINMALGGDARTTAVNWFTGNVAEWWITNTDIQPDGTALSNQTLAKLAYNGPFSVPIVANNLVDYRPLRYELGSEEDSGLDYYQGRLGRKNWVNTNGVTVGPHTPLITSQYNLLRIQEKQWMYSYPDVAAATGGAISQIY